jgi:hypothetical protein
MSFNHLNVDPCTYAKQLSANANALTYMLDTNKFEHNQKCRHELGIRAGTVVSHIRGNLVDLESDLRRQTRILSKCSSSSWMPIPENGLILNDKTDPIDTRMEHLPACQMIRYRSVPLPPALNLPRCADRK